jgi:ribosomal protein L37E
MTMSNETVPCETCGEQTFNVATNRCNICWEVESRLDMYLRRGREKARRILYAALEPAGPSEDDNPGSR